MKHLTKFFCTLFLITLSTVAISQEVTAEIRQDATENARQTDNDSTLNELIQKHGRMSSQVWSYDQTTIPFGKRRKRVMFSGLRLVFEPQLGVLFQKGENRFENTNFDKLPKFALETNLYKAYLSFQVGLIYPSTITFDSKSPILQEGGLAAGGTEVSIDHGFTIGLTMVDGVFAIGWGRIVYDKRDFTESFKNNNYDSFLYFNIQPASAIKSLVKYL